MSYKQLDLDDRIAIRFGLMQKLSLREIARQLNRLCEFGFEPELLRPARCFC